jgi:REP element-mobilizing transposase RayT
MGRQLRHLPLEVRVVEVTNRTIQRRLLLKPSKALRRIVLGALGRAQRRYGVTIHAFVVLSNHYHLLVSVRDARQLAAFVGYFESKLAKEVIRLTGWLEVVFAHRYHAIAVSNEEAAQVARLDYILSHGVKEHLVAHPCDWPGAHSARALLEGKALRGLWHDRTGEYRARARGKPLRLADFVHRETVELTPLPCWQTVPLEIQRQRMKQLVAAAVEQARVDPQRLRKILQRVQPTDRPRPARRTPAPRFHCASRAVRRELEQAYSQFLGAYRAAAAALRRGELTAPFPDGCFPPPRAFVTATTIG